MEPNLSFNWITVPAGEVRAQVSRLRATYTVSPRSFVGALVQYNSAAQLMSANVRFRWSTRRAATSSSSSARTGTGMTASAG